MKKMNKLIRNDEDIFHFLEKIMLSYDEILSYE